MLFCPEVFRSPSIVDCCFWFLSLSLSLLSAIFLSLLCVHVHCPHFLSVAVLRVEPLATRTRVRTSPRHPASCLRHRSRVTAVRYRQVRAQFPLKTIPVAYFYYYYYYYFGKLSRTTCAFVLTVFPVTTSSSAT